MVEVLFKLLRLTGTSVIECFWKVTYFLQKSVVTQKSPSTKTPKIILNWLAQGMTYPV